MSSEVIIYNLISTNTALTAVVPIASIYAGLIPLKATLPAIAFNLVSSFENTSIGLTTLTQTGRVQLTVAAKSYAEVKQIIKLIKTACNHKRGTFNNILTHSVILDIAGADFRDDDPLIFYSTIDFKVSFQD